MQMNVTRDEAVAMNLNQLQLLTATMLGWNRILPAGEPPASEGGVTPMKGSPPGAQGDEAELLPNYVEDDGAAVRVRSFIEGEGYKELFEDMMREMFGTTPHMASPDETCRVALYCHASGKK